MIKWQNLERLKFNLKKKTLKINRVNKYSNLSFPKSIISNDNQKKNFNSIVKANIFIKNENYKKINTLKRSIYSVKKKSKESEKLKLVDKSKIEKIIKNASYGKYIYKMEIKEKINLYYSFKKLLKNKIFRIVIFFLIMYFLIYKIRLFRFSLSKILYKFTSEPMSIIYELYFGSNLNNYVSDIIDFLINDPEIQKTGIRYLLDLFEDQLFIKCISDFTNHLIVIILKEERLTILLQNKLNSLFKTELLEKEFTKFLLETLNREDVKGFIIDYIGYLLLRNETEEGVNNFLELIYDDLFFSPKHKLTISKLFSELLSSNLVRRRYFNKHNKHMLNDYPDEENFNKVVDIIKNEEYVYPNPISKYQSEIEIYESSKKKFQILYENNNNYIDGYLNPKNPERIRILELGKLFNNIIYTDLDYDSDTGYFTNFGIHLNKEYADLMVDKERYAKKILINPDTFIDENDDVRKYLDLDSGNGNYFEVDKNSHKKKSINLDRSLYYEIVNSYSGKYQLKENVENYKNLEEINEKILKHSHIKRLQEKRSFFEKIENKCSILNNEITEKKLKNELSDTLNDIYSSLDNQKEEYKIDTSRNIELIINDIQKDLERAELQLKKKKIFDELKNKI